MPQVSIIVPIYGVEAYLPRCVDSILAQTLRNIEVILVDDGSPDRSGAIADAYARRDSRVSVIHKCNGGLVSAWKAGVAQSCAEYVGFVDSDDWIEPEMYKRLFAKTDGGQVDIVSCSFVHEFADHAVYGVSQLAAGLYQRSTIESCIFPVMINNGTCLGRQILPNRCTKLFRRNLIENNLKTSDNTIVFGEDFLLVFPCFCDAQSVYLFHDYYPYHYVENRKSITRKFDPALWEKTVRLNDALRAIAVQKDAYDFAPQLEADLLGLALVDLMVGAFDHPQTPAWQIQALAHEICQDPRFARAYDHTDISRYTLREKVTARLMRSQNERLLLPINQFVDFLRPIRHGLKRGRPRTSLGKKRT